MKRIFYLLAGILSGVNSSAQFQLAIDIPPSNYSSLPHDLTVFNNKLYMAASGGVGGNISSTATMVQAQPALVVT